MNAEELSQLDRDALLKLQSQLQAELVTRGLAPALATEDDVWEAHFEAFYHECECLQQCECTLSVCNDCCECLGCRADKECDKCDGWGLTSDPECKLCNGTRNIFIPDSKKEEYHKTFSECYKIEQEALTKQGIIALNFPRYMDSDLEDSLKEAIEKCGGKFFKSPVDEETFFIATPKIQTEEK